MDLDEGTHMGQSDGKNNPETTEHAALGTRKAHVFLPSPQDLVQREPPYGEVKTGCLWE